MGLRSFQTRFLECVGLGAKEYARLLRLQATIRALDGDDSPLSQLAFDAGFADQAHATRELARLTGLTPARLRAALRRDREGDDTIRLAAAFVRGRA
jgi:AraC-like DNA-binding protein